MLLVILQGLSLLYFPVLVNEHADLKSTFQGTTRMRPEQNEYG